MRYAAPVQQILEAPLDGDGIDLQSVETHLVEHQVRLIYVNPTFQNPTGQTMSETKRRDLLALRPVVSTRSFLKTIIRPIGGSLAGLFRRSPRWQGQNIGFSTLTASARRCSPGSDSASLVVPPGLRRVVLNRKAALDLHGPSFLQEALAHFLLRAITKFSSRERGPVTASVRKACASGCWPECRREQKSARRTAA